MIKSLLRYWNLFWHFRKLEFMRITHNRGELIFWTCISLMWAIMHMLSISLYVSINGQLAGWQPAEVFILISFYSIIDTFIWDWIEPNMIEFARLTNSGELSSLLMKPINIQIFLMFQKNSFNNLLRFLFGMVNLLYWTTFLGMQWNIFVVLSVVGLVATSVLFIYGLWFLFTTLSLWTDRLANVNEIVPNIRQFWQVPSGVYQGVVSFFLTFVLPLSLITTVPAEAVLQRGNLITQSALLLGAVVILLLGRQFFLRSIREFDGAGN